MIASVAKRPHQESPPREHQHEEEPEIIASIKETIPSTALDQRLRREQTEAILELISAYLSRVHSVPPTSEDEKPCD
jgi:hypothetical protein